MRIYIHLYAEIIRFLRWRTPLLILLMALVGLTEGLSVALLLPLLDRVGISYAPGQSRIGELLSKVLVFVGGSVGIVSLLLIVIGVALVQAALFITLNWWMASAGHSYQRQRQTKLFHAFVSAKWEFFTDRKSGELTNLIVTESERLAQAFINGLYLFSASLVTCIYLVFAMAIAWPVALALIAAAALMTMSVTRIYRKSYEIGQSMSPLNAELQSVLGEHLSGIKLIKAVTYESIAEETVKRLVRRLERANRLTRFLPTLVRALFEFLAFSLLAAIFAFSKNFGLAPGNVIIVLALFVRLFPRITTAQVYIHTLNAFLHALDVFDQLQTAAESKAEVHDKSLVERFTVTLPAKLVIKDVEVKFRAHAVLENINLTIPLPGMIGIVGGSGAGKSTLVHAMLGLVMPTAGSIRLGPYELKAASLYDWRRKIGYVPQETILFHSSVRDNLILGNPSASDAEIRLAAQRAHADDFIAELPQGYDTIIGDQGVRLSGGQRQRLGIARALLMNPILLLLDEAMSALDNKSESEVLSALNELRTHMGILVIAHRLGAVRNADFIGVLEAGRLVEFGTWDDLVARGERLHALIQTQAIL